MGVVVVVDACLVMMLLFDLVLVLTVCDARWLSVIVDDDEDDNPAFVLFLL